MLVDFLILENEDEVKDFEKKYNFKFSDAPANTPIYGIIDESSKVSQAVRKQVNFESAVILNSMTKILYILTENSTLKG